MSKILRAVNSNQIRYEDNQVEMGRVRLGASAPTWRTYNHGVGGGIAFDVLGFAVNNYIEFNVQSYHKMKLYTILDCHLHFILPNTTDIGDKFQFQLDVINASIDAQYTVPSGSPFTAEHTIVANDNTYHRVLNLADIPPIINSTVSSIYNCRLTRIAATADEYASEVYVKFIDCHYQVDDRGSQSETSK